MRARSFFVVVLVTAGAVVSACARGTTDTATDTASALPAPGGDAGPCAACPSGQVCSAGRCVPENADDDHDGFTARVDCDDGDPGVHPGAAEVCNGKDDDCSGGIDEGFDTDGDGWASCAIGTRKADCDDGDPDVHPGATEVCNGKDDDCDGMIDESEDLDHDGFFACAKNGAPSDCDDADPNVKPGATEVCNGKDDDCNGRVDEVPATLKGSLSSPVDAHWALAGSAIFSNGWVQLTPDQTYQAGALWWNATYLFDTFDVAATFWLPQKSDCADGLAFAFVPGTNVGVAGEAGYGYGLKGLGGVGVAVDTFANVGEPTAPFLVVLDAQTGAHLARQSVPEVRDAQDHRLHVKLAGGKISVWLDSVSYIFELPLPGYAAFTGHWGFTAGTGGISCLHFVRDVTMSFPNGQGCVP